MDDLLNSLYAQKIKLELQILELNNRINELEIEKLDDLIDLPIGTEFYLPPATGFWSGKTFKLYNDVWIIPQSGVPFPFERGDYVVGKNIKLGKMPKYSMSQLAWADW